MFHKILFLATGAYAPLSSSQQQQQHKNSNASKNQHHNILPQLSYLLPLLAMKTFLNSSLTPYFFECDASPISGKADLWFRRDVHPPKYLEEFMKEENPNSPTESFVDSEDSEEENDHQRAFLRYDKVYLPAGIVFENSTTTKFCRKLTLGSALKLSQLEFREEIISRVDYSIQELTLNACFVSEQQQQTTYRNEIHAFEQHQKQKNGITIGNDLDEETNHHVTTYFSCLAKCKYLKKLSFINLSVFNETSTYVVAQQDHRQTTSLLFDPLDFVQSTIAPIADHLESLTFVQSESASSSSSSAPSMYLNYLIQDMFLTLHHRMRNLKHLTLTLPSSMWARHHEQRQQGTCLDRIVASCFAGTTTSNVTSEIQKYFPVKKTETRNAIVTSSSSSDDDEDYSSYFEEPSTSNSPSKTSIPKKKIILPKNHNDVDDSDEEPVVVFCDVIQKSLQHLIISVDREWHFSGLTLPKLLSDFKCLYTLSLTCGMANTDMRKLVEEANFVENLSFLPPTIQNLTLSISQSTPARCLAVISAALCESLVEFKYWGQLSYDSLLIFAKNLGGILRSFTFLFGLNYINQHFRQSTSMMTSDDEATLTEITKRDQILRPLLLMEKIQFLEINDFGLNRRPIDKYFSIECYDEREIEALKTKFGDSAVERVLERFEFDVPLENKNNNNSNNNRNIQTLILAGYTNGTCLEKCFPKLENIRLKTETDMSFFFAKNYSKFGSRLKSLRIDCVNEIVADFDMLSVIGSFSLDLEVLEMDGLCCYTFGFPIEEFENLIREKFQFLSQLKKLRVLRAHISGLGSRFLWKVANNEI